MLAAFSALILAAAAHAAPDAALFEQPLIQLRANVLASAARLNTEEQLKKADKNVQLTANQAWSGRGNLSSATAQARVHRSDPAIGAQLNQLEQDLDIYARNCDIVRKQVVAIDQAAVKDPTLAALAKKLYEHARVLDSNAGYLAIEARNDNIDLGVAGYGGQAYQLKRLADAGAALTPDTREAAKSALGKIQ
jgi:hypothetical protein